MSKYAKYDNVKNIYVITYRSKNFVLNLKLKMEKASPKTIVTSKIHYIYN